MYPLEESVAGDYVELIHFLNALNKRFLIISGNATDRFDDYLENENGFKSTLKIIKTSKTQKELESNLHLLFDHYAPKINDILSGKGEMHQRVDKVFQEIGNIKAQNKAKEAWVIEPISQRKIDKISEEMLSAEKLHKNAVCKVQDAKNIMKDSVRVKEFMQEYNQTPEQFRALFANMCENYRKDLLEKRKEHFAKILDYNEMLFENVSIASINEQRKSKAKVAITGMETA